MKNSEKSNKDQRKLLIELLSKPRPSKPGKMEMGTKEWWDAYGPIGKRVLTVEPLPEEFKE